MSGGKFIRIARRCPRCHAEHYHHVETPVSEFAARARARIICAACAHRWWGRLKRDERGLPEPVKCWGCGRYVAGVRGSLSYHRGVRHINLRCPASGHPVTGPRPGSKEAIYEQSSTGMES